MTTTKMDFPSENLDGMDSQANEINDEYQAPLIEQAKEERKTDPEMEDAEEEESLSQQQSGGEFNDNDKDEKDEQVGETHPSSTMTLQRRSSLSSSTSSSFRPPGSQRILRASSGSAGCDIQNIILGDKGSHYMVIFLQRQPPQSQQQQQSQEQQQEGSSPKWMEVHWTIPSLPPGLRRRLCNEQTTTKHGHRGKIVNVRCRYGNVAFNVSSHGKAWFVREMFRQGHDNASYLWNRMVCADLTARLDKAVKEAQRDRVDLRVAFGEREDQYVVLVGAKRYYFSTSVPTTLRNRLYHLRQAKRKVFHVHLWHNNGYFIRDEDGIDWSLPRPNVPLLNELKKGCSACVGDDQEILDVALARNGNWIVLRKDRFSASAGIHPELKSILQDFYNSRHCSNQYQERDPRQGMHQGHRSDNTPKHDAKQLANSGTRRVALADEQDLRPSPKRQKKFSRDEELPVLLPMLNNPVSRIRERHDAEQEPDDYISRVDGRDPDTMQQRKEPRFAPDDKGLAIHLGTVQDSDPLGEHAMQGLDNRAHSGRSVIVSGVAAARGSAALNDHAWQQEYAEQPKAVARRSTSMNQVVAPINIVSGKQPKLEDEESGLNATLNRGLEGPIRPNVVPTLGPSSMVIPNILIDISDSPIPDSIIGDIHLAGSPSLSTTRTSMAVSRASAAVLPSPNLQIQAQSASSAATRTSMETSRTSTSSLLPSSTVRVQSPFFQDFKCVEKVEMRRLRQIVNDLRSDRALRQQKLHHQQQQIKQQSEQDQVQRAWQHQQSSDLDPISWGTSTTQTSGSRTTRNLAASLKALQQCQMLENFAEQLYQHLERSQHEQSTSLGKLDKLGCVTYDMIYRQRDPSFRGRLFADGLPIATAKQEFSSADRQAPQTVCRGISDVVDHQQNAWSLQGMHPDLRKALTGAFAHEISGCQSHDVRLLCSLAWQCHLQERIPTWMSFCDHRSQWLLLIATAHGVTEDQAEQLSSQMIRNGGSYEGWLHSEAVHGTIIVNRTSGVLAREQEQIRSWADKMQTEITALCDSLMEHPRFHWISIDLAELIQQQQHSQASVTEEIDPNSQNHRSNDTRDRSIKSSLLWRIIESCENEVLSLLHRFCHERHWQVRCKLFDSLLVERDSMTNSTSASGIDDECQALQELISAAQQCCASHGWDICLEERPSFGKQDNTLGVVAKARQALQEYVPRER